MLHVSWKIQNILIPIVVEEPHWAVLITKRETVSYFDSILVWNNDTNEIIEMQSKKLG